jgi:hypothetical protein
MGLGSESRKMKKLLASTALVLFLLRATASAQDPHGIQDCLINAHRNHGPEAPCYQNPNIAQRQYQQLEQLHQWQEGAVKRNEDPVRQKEEREKAEAIRRQQQYLQDQQPTREKAAAEAAAPEQKARTAPTAEEIGKWANGFNACADRLDPLMHHQAEANGIGVIFEQTLRKLPSAIIANCMVAMRAVKPSLTTSSMACMFHRLQKEGASRISPAAVEFCAAAMKCEEAKKTPSTTSQQAVSNYDICVNEAEGTVETANFEQANTQLRSADQADPRAFERARACIDIDPSDFQHVKDCSFHAFDGSGTTTEFPNAGAEMISRYLGECIIAEVDSEADHKLSRRVWDRCLDLRIGKSMIDQQKH